MYYKVFFIVLLVSLELPLIAQNEKKGYEIDIEVKNLNDSVAFLTYYYGKGQYYRDTSLITGNGTMTFSSKEDTLEHGMYSILVKDLKVFDLMVDNQKISLKTDTIGIATNMKVKNSPENEVFFEYLAFLENQHKKLKKLNEERNGANEARKNEIDTLQMKLDEEVRAYIGRMHQEHAGTLTSNFVKTLDVPQVPDPPKDKNGNIDSTFRFRYYKDHFLDDIDFTDERLLRTATYYEKINTYLKKLTHQIADSLIKSVDVVLEKAAQDVTLFKFTLSTLTYDYERSQQMGMDAVFVHLAKNYFMKGRAKEWFTDKQLEKLAERATALDPLLIGKKAPNIIVKDTALKEFVQLYDVNAPLVILYIWSPECGHCKVATPKLKELYHKYRDRGVEVFGVNNDFENEKWIKFINKHELDWIHGSDGGDFRSNFRGLYDVYSTPQTYLLDKDKKILSKKMSVESLDNIINYFLEKRENDEKKMVNEK